MASPTTTEQWARHLGEQIRQLRVDSQLEQTEVAERASLSRSAVQALENDRGTSVSTLVKVLRALDSLDWLDTLHTFGAEPSPLEMFRADQAAQTTARPRFRRRFTER